MGGRWGTSDNLKFSRAMFVDSESGLCNTVHCSRAAAVCILYFVPDVRQINKVGICLNSLDTFELFGRNVDRT